MKKNKALKMLLAVAIAISLTVIPVQTEAAVKSPFKDVSRNSPYYEIVHEMRDSHIISGYKNGEFRPTEVITRKHAAALVNRATKLPATKPFVPFKDVTPKNTFFNDVKKLQQAGIFEPDAKGNFYPNQPITRAEMAKVLTIAFDLEVKVELDFMDVPKDHPASKYIRALYSNGITTGDWGFYNPDKPVTRVHYAVFLHRLIHMDDPIDPTEPAQKIRGQFARISEPLLGEPDQVALAMLSMLQQKITHDPADYLITDRSDEGYADMRLYWAGHSLGQMAKENILYLKRFAEKGSEQEVILDRWLQGDFSKIKDEFFTLKAIGDPDFFNCAVCEQKFAINIRTERAEEAFVSALYGKEGLKRHRDQWVEGKSRLVIGNEIMKATMLAFLLLTILALAACSSKDDANEKADNSKENQKTEETSGTVAVDKGLLNVEVTIPASFLEGENIDTVVAEAKEDGIKDVKKNDDGSVTYKMTKAKHKEMMEEMKANVTEYVDELINDKDFASIKNVEYNKDFSKFTLEVDKEAFENSSDGFAVLGLAMSGMFYQLYDGVDAEKLNVTIDTVDQSTGEVFGTVDYPEAFEDME